ncbi:MAG: cobalamin biosynthesis protein CobD [Planctomycetes bacterium]|nr:cobalamin biosynthesis protein CobD [Planctomycetota bacterium]
MTSLAVAFLADTLIGDPRWLPHPVRLFGAVASCVDRFRKRVGFDIALGILLALGLPAGVTCGSYAGLAWLRERDPRAAFAAEAFALYTCLAARSMAKYARAVEGALRAGDLPAARQAVGRIVGRQTAELDGAGVARAAVESVAESSVDGVLSPLFWAAVGVAWGVAAPAALAFKAVSTLDSMVGYRTGGYARFGWASARLDDLANWIPARLSIPLIAIASALTGHRPFAALRVGLRDGGRHPSPNAARSEAAFAGALGVALGGPMLRRGEVDDRPVLGAEGGVPAADTIRSSVDLMWVTSFLGLLCALAAHAALSS